MAAREPGQAQATSKPVEVYRSPQGEAIERYEGRDVVLPAIEMVKRGRYHYRRNARTGAWVSYDPWLGKYGCGVCHTNCCDAECPGQECPDRYGRRSGKRAEETGGDGEGEGEGRRIPLAAAMKQAMGVYGGTVKPDELTPPTEEEQTA